MEPQVKALAEELAAVRRQAADQLQRLTETDLEAPLEYAGRMRNARFLLYQFGRHELEHLTHIRKIRRALGGQQSEAQMILAHNAAIRGQLLGELLGLQDEELNRVPREGEWSIRQVLEHAIEVEKRYLGMVEKAVAAAATPS